MTKVTKHEILRGTKRDLISYIETELHIMPYENSLFDDRRRFTLKDQSLQSQLTNLVDHCCSSGCVFYAEQSAKPALDSDIAPVVTITKLYVFITEER